MGCTTTQLLLFTPLYVHLAHAFTLPPPSGPSVLSILFNSGSSSSANSVPGGRTAVGAVAAGNLAGCEQAAGLCSQAVWADVGFALGGIQAPVDVCSKYTPSTTCLSRSLDQCYGQTTNATATLLLAAASVVVKWCYDPTHGVLNELADNAHCYSGAVFESVAKRNCLSTVLAPHGLGAEAPIDAQGRLKLNALLGNLIGSYQSSTVLCMHEVISELCGERAAAISLGPAVEQLLISDRATADDESTEIDEAIHNNRIDNGHEVDQKVDSENEWASESGANLSGENGTVFMEVRSSACMMKAGMIVGVIVGSNIALQLLMVI